MDVDAKSKVSKITRERRTLSKRGSTWLQAAYCSCLGSKMAPRYQIAALLIREPSARTQGNQYKNAHCGHTLSHEQPKGLREVIVHLAVPTQPSWAPETVYHYCTNPERQACNLGGLGCLSIPSSWQPVRLSTPALSDFATLSSCQCFLAMFTI